MKELALRFLMFLASLFTAKQLGKSDAKKELAEDIAKERDEDAKIASGAFVARPMSGLRFRKK